MSDKKALPKGLFKEYDTVIFFDTETSGLNAETDHIVEMGAVVYKKSGIPRRLVEDTVISDLVKLPEGATMDWRASKINGITDKKLAKEGIDREEAFSKLTNCISGKTLIVAYNAHFDYAFLLNELDDFSTKGMALGDSVKKVEACDVYDPCGTARVRVVGDKGYEVGHRLCDMLSYYRVDGVENSHHALDDVYATIGLVEAFNEEQPITKEDMNILAYPDKYGKPQGADGVEARSKVKYAAFEDLQKVTPPIRVIKEDMYFKYPAHVTKKIDGVHDKMYMKSATKQDYLTYFEDTIRRETDNYAFDYRTSETKMTDGSPAMVLSVDRAGVKEETTFNFMNEERLPITWQDVETFMKAKAPAHKTITGIPSLIEEPTVEAEATNEKEI